MDGKTIKLQIVSNIVYFQIVCIDKGANDFLLWLRTVDKKIDFLDEKLFNVANFKKLNRYVHGWYILLISTRYSWERVKSDSTYMTNSLVRSFSPWYETNETPK